MTDVALIPEVVRPDQVTGPVEVTDSTVLDQVLNHVMAAADRLGEPELGPAAHEVGKWLRARAIEARQARPRYPHRCVCPYGCDGDDGW